MWISRPGKYKPLVLYLPSCWCSRSSLQWFLLSRGETSSLCLPPYEVWLPPSFAHVPCPVMSLEAWVYRSAPHLFPLYIRSKPHACLNTPMSYWICPTGDPTLWILHGDPDWLEVWQCNGFLNTHTIWLIFQKFFIYLTILYDHYMTGQ